MQQKTGESGDNYAYAFHHPSFIKNDRDALDDIKPLDSRDKDIVLSSTNVLPRPSTLRATLLSSSRMLLTPLSPRTPWSAPSNGGPTVAFSRLTRPTLKPKCCKSSCCCVGAAQEELTAIVQPREQELDLAQLHSQHGPLWLQAGGFPCHHMHADSRSATAPVVPTAKPTCGA